LKALLSQQPDLADTSNGKVAWEGDALNKILGAEKPGHVHGLGLVPNPKQVFDALTSRSMKNLNVTTWDETSSEDVVALRLELEKLQNHVQKQDDTILDLQHALEQQKGQHVNPITSIFLVTKQYIYLAFSNLIFFCVVIGMCRCSFIATKRCSQYYETESKYLYETIYVY
jgi:hypothetical protein